MVVSRSSLSVVCLLVVAVYSVSSDSATSAPFYGAVNVLNETSISSFNYTTDHAVGEPTTSPIPNGFPVDACTICAARTPTEYCNSGGSRECFRISDEFVGKISVNGSLLSSHELSGVPRSFHRIDQTRYVIVYGDFHYQVLHEGKDGTTELGDRYPPSDNPDDVAVVDEGENGARYVQLVDGLDGQIVSYGILSEYFYANPYYGYESCDDSPYLQSTSAPGKFFLHCQKSGSEAHFLCSIDNNLCDEIDLCGDPYTSPSGEDSLGSFATHCGTTLTLYRYDMQQNSYSFANITSISFLDTNTLLVDTGSKHYSVSVETFLGSNASDAVVELLRNTSECTRVHKLVSPDLYAAVCMESGGISYSIRLANTTTGYNFRPIENLSTEPLAIYAEIQLLSLPFSSMSSSSASSTSISTPEPTIVLETTSSQPTLVSPTHTTSPSAVSSVISSHMMVTTPFNPPNTNPSPIGTAVPIIVIVVVVLMSVTFLIVTLLLFIFVCKASRKSNCLQLRMKVRGKYPIQEMEGGINNPTTCTPSLSSTSSTTTGSNRSSLTITTEAVTESGSHTQL